jgi:hypothetical protein
MALASYGTIRPSDVSPEDVEIILHYTPSRDDTANFVLTKLDSVSLLRPYFNNSSTGGNANIEILGGLYNLKLPADQFNAIGIYTIYLRPTQIPNFFRVITSSFFCEPVIQNLTNTSQKAIRYRYTDSNSGLLFCTLSPSSAPTNKPNAIPYIGQPDQDIIITNTFFNPITLDIEVAEHDFSTLAIALYGNQTKSIDDGIYTYYDSQNNIYRQYNLYEIRDQFNELLFEVRQDRGNNIDFSKNFTNITS